jgi:putative transposase
VKGRKRHLMVDSLGQVMKVIVTEANGGERVGAAYGLMELRLQYPELTERLTMVLADAGYRGDKFRLAVWLLFQAGVEIRENLKREFAVVAKRWVVERTFAWFNLYRRLSKDYELLPEVSESAVYATMIHLMLRRLAPAL